MPDPAPGGESSKTLDRGIRVLEALALPEHATGLTISGLATELGIGRPAVYRLVATLTEHRLIVRRADGRVRLGRGVARLAAAVTPVVRSQARPVLRDLADALGATAHLTVVEGDEAVALVVVEPSWTQFHVAYRTGSRHALNRGAAGRAILAGRAGRLYVVQSDGELQTGAHGMALPIASGTGLVEASVGVVSLGPLVAAEVTPRLRVAAEQLRRVLD